MTKKETKSVNLKKEVKEVKAVKAPVKAVEKAPVESKVKPTAKSIYEILETGTTTINVNKVAIEIELPPLFKEIPDLDDEKALTEYVQNSPYFFAFAQYAVKWSVRHLRAESKKKTPELTREAVRTWTPKLAKKVTRKAEERKAKVEALKGEGLTPEEIIERLINEA